MKESPRRAKQWASILSCGLKSRNRKQSNILKELMTAPYEEINEEIKRG